MAKNTNKRVATKHIRDGIKSKYPKGSNCEICGTTEDLEYHHYNTLSILLKQYSRDKNIPIGTDEEVLAMRDEFYQAHWHEVVEHGVTLCSTHHSLLHRTYGREPALSTASKQENWVKRLKDKGTGKDTQTFTTEENRFSRHASVCLDSSNRFSRLIL